jgi:hypothetical protein
MQDPKLFDNFENLKKIKKKLFFSIYPIFDNFP